MKLVQFNRIHLLFAAVSFCSASTIAHAAEAESYVLAKKKFVPPTATVMTKEFNMDVNEAAINVVAGDQQIPGSMTRKEFSKEKCEVISPVKLRITTTEKKTTSKMVVGGKENPPADEADPLLNLPVILELKDGKWTASLEGVAEPTDSQQKRLKEKEISANNDSDFEMYGDTPRKVGDEWKVDASKIGFGGGKDLVGDYQTKLIEVKEIEGVKCAVLKSTFDFKGKLDSNPGDPLMTMGMKGEAVSIRSIADMIDLDVKINAIMTIDGAPAEHVKMHVQGPMIGTQKIKILRP